MAGAVENVTTYKNLLVDSKYNTAHIYFHGSDISRLETALSSFGSDIDVILEDRSWNLNSGSVGVGSLSYGNYLKMEAEYMYKY